MVTLLTAVVGVLVICHAPRTVINLFECYNIGIELSLAPYYYYHYHLVVLLNDYLFHI